MATVVHSMALEAQTTSVESAETQVVEVHVNLTQVMH
jgi:hypothetical protein